MPAEPIPTTLLGRTNLHVSKVCFGTSSLGDMLDTYGYGVDEGRARGTIRAIFSGPVNFLDTSRIYGFGRSEERIGDVIRERGRLPEGFVVSTKLDRDPETNRFDAAQARRSLEESLKALGLERIDILHLHDPEHADSLEGTVGPKGALPELFRMKEEGLVQAVGLAAGSVEIMMPLLLEWDFDVLITHNRFTLTNRNADAMIDFARSKGIAVLNAAPYAGGVLAKGSTAYPRYVYQEASEETLDPVRRIEAMCARHEVPPGAAALQFSMRDERIASTICGVSKPERVEQTIEWARWPIPEAMWEELASLPFSTDDPEANRQYDVR
ncbi:aldo/keto reductase [Microvirga arabica]|uniref:Aldo/keto reductase n=1 Tax=Microvirga arabica TaxID=1128671 RepID=A0ABV6YFI9_9HYPH|nr:aldo/keto reductase [Microvirga arabica]MBM1170800.1 aldo/keto reductase [Microvirga arabica]